GAKPATPTPASAAAKAEEKKPEPAEKKEDAKQEPSLAWEDKEAQQVVLKVTNNTEKKQALKIKCSNNSVFKVNPVFAMIELGKTLDIVVTRKNGPLKTEKLLILTTPVSSLHPTSPP
ncbi:MSP domain protein, partial [Ancylostoma ceylanicum]